MEMHRFEQYIVNVPDFPKEGVIFKDIFPLLRDHLDDVITEMTKNIDLSKLLKKPK